MLKNISSITLASALVLGLTSGAFACDGCALGTAKTAAKSTKTVANAKIAPKAAKKGAVKLVAYKSSVLKAAAVKTASKTESHKCPMCEAKAAAKK